MAPGSPRPCRHGAALLVLAVSGTILIGLCRQEHLHPARRTCFIGTRRIHDPIIKHASDSGLRFLTGSALLSSLPAIAVEGDEASSVAAGAATAMDGDMGATMQAAGGTSPEIPEILTEPVIPQETVPSALGGIWNAITEALSAGDVGRGLNIIGDEITGANERFWDLVEKEQTPWEEIGAIFLSAVLIANSISILWPIFATLFQTEDPGLAPRSYMKGGIPASRREPDDELLAMFASRKAGKGPDGIDLDDLRLPPKDVDPRAAQRRPEGMSYGEGLKRANVFNKLIPKEMLEKAKKKTPKRNRPSAA